MHSKISARLFVSFFERRLRALEQAAEFPLPLLLMHATADRMVPRYPRRAGEGRSLQDDVELARKKSNLARMRVGLEKPRFLLRRQGCVWTNFPDCGKILEL